MSTFKSLRNPIKPWITFGEKGVRVLDTKLGSPIPNISLGLHGKKKTKSKR